MAKNGLVAREPPERATNGGDQRRMERYFYREVKMTFSLKRRLGRDLLRIFELRG